MSVNEVKWKRPGESAIEPFNVLGTDGPQTSRTFVIGNEDHTIGNSLRHILIQNHNVTFAGYSIPHPSEPIMHLRIQTNPNTSTNKSTNNNNNTVYTAIDALKSSCITLQSQCDIFMEQLEELIPEVRDDRIYLENQYLELNDDNDDNQNDNDDDNDDDNHMDD